MLVLRATSSGPLSGGVAVAGSHLPSISTGRRQLPSAVGTICVMLQDGYGHSSSSSVTKVPRRGGSRPRLLTTFSSPPQEPPQQILSFSVCRSGRSFSLLAARNQGVLGSSPALARARADPDPRMRFLSTSSGTGRQQEPKESRMKAMVREYGMPFLIWYGMPFLVCRTIVQDLHGTCRTFTGDHSSPTMGN